MFAVTNPNSILFEDACEISAALHPLRLPSLPKVRHALSAGG